MKFENLNFLEPSGPLQACNGTDLPFFFLLNLVCRGYCALALYLTSLLHLNRRRSVSLAQPASRLHYIHQLRQQVTCGSPCSYVYARIDLTFKLILNNVQDSNMTPCRWVKSDVSEISTRTLKKEAESVNETCVDLHQLNEYLIRQQ